MTAVFDIGKTNKKFFVFDEDLREVHREYVRFDLVEDEDGHPAEDLPALQRWVREVFHRILATDKFAIKAINFSSYGASFVHLDAAGEVIAPLYNYTKGMDAELEQQFYSSYAPGGEVVFSRQTGSDRSGFLNSGLQLYWLKHRRPEVFSRIRYSLHFPQYLSYLLTGIPLSEFTSIGCHTALWDYEREDYHHWVYAEGVAEKLAPIVPTDTSISMNYRGKRLSIGVGIHDSSAALLPYLRSQKKPFALVSTGTWSISLNAFTGERLSADDVNAGCINYMRPDGKAVKAARLFLGEEYKRQTNRLAELFGVPGDHHETIRFNLALYREIVADFNPWFRLEVIEADGPRETTIPPGSSFERAYHNLMIQLTRLQADNIRTALGGTTVKKLFIDGGFSNNEVYLNLLTHHFRELKVRTTDASLGSALGAAIVISQQNLKGKFLRDNYGLKKHRSFVMD